VPSGHGSRFRGHGAEHRFIGIDRALMRRGETRRFLVGAGCSTTPDWRRRGALDPAGDRITSRSGRRLMA
jgi:hypothetical protein